MTTGILRRAVRRMRAIRLRSGRLTLGNDGFGASLLNHYLSHLFHAYPIDCVIDVGANRGQFLGLLRSQIGFDGGIFSFEPGPAAFAKLQDTVAQEQDVQIFQTALGAEEGELALNIMELDVLSSFHAPRHDDVSLSNNKVVETRMVPVRRLDDVIDEIPRLKSSSGILLKVDTQGFDLEVLKGLERYKDRVAAVLIEVPFARIYDNSPEFPDYFDALKEKGFEIAAFAPGGVVKDRIVDTDCLFINTRYSDPD